jgi:RNA polymerase sigma-70 factor (ECF subfamily)
MQTELNFDNEFLLFQDQLRNYLYRLSANKSDTEDLLHDTFIKARSKFDTFLGKSSLKTWVFSIATNLARDNQRVKNRWAENVQDICKDTTMMDQKCEDRIWDSFSSQSVKRFEMIEHINYCFTCLAKNLSLNQQIAIILKEIFNFKRAEISEIMQV